MSSAESDKGRATPTWPVREIVSVAPRYLAFCTAASRVGLAKTCPAHLDHHPVLSNTHILRRHRQQYRLRPDSQSFLVCAECLFDAGRRPLSPATNRLDNNVLSNSHTSQTASRNIFPDSGSKHNQAWGTFSDEDSLLIHGTSFAPNGATEAIPSRSQGQE